MFLAHLEVGLAWSLAAMFLAVALGLLTGVIRIIVDGVRDEMEGRE